MFKLLGYEVVALKRISIGPVQLGRLREGEVRKMTGEEIRLLTQRLAITAKHDRGARKGKPRA
jgi:16S rRNA U516 pseudouridylate synthase RsuA-like enzyme